jgi:5-methylcytosine-specific restriction endonuclease McrA
MKTDLRTARAALESAARGFDPSSCSGQDAVDLVEALGVQRRLIDGMIAKAAKRVEDTAAYTSDGDRNAAELCARLVGVGSGEAKRAIETATKLEALPLTDAAVRAGRLSARQADLIVAAATDDPSVERDLLKAAAKGLVPLRDECIAARARREDQAAPSKRQHASRSFQMWPTPDGMVEGHFTVTPEVGGQIKSVIEHGTRRRFRDARSDGAHESQDAYAADAFTDAVTGDPAATKSGGFTTHVVIDHEALVRGNAIGGERCEIPGVGPVSVEWVRRLLGSAFVTAIVKQGKDITSVSHLGRHIPAELRTAMIVSGRECTIEGCSGREYLELDHSEIDHARQGPTAWWNLIWLCSIHHKRKTQGWKLGPPHPTTGKRRLEPPDHKLAASAA